jgi:hypothetical protein
MSDFANQFAGLKAAKAVPAKTEAERGIAARMAERAAAKKQTRIPSGNDKERRGKLAKSLDPEYERVTVYVRKATRKKAWRKWEDSTDGDFSDLSEELLQRYLRGEL